MAWVQEIYDTLYDPNTVCVACISHGKDSLAMLRAIKHLGLPLHRIVTTDVWATQDIPAVLPEMWEWKTEADKTIKELYGIEVEHICAMQNGGCLRLGYQDLFYSGYESGQFVGNIHGFPNTKGAWCQKLKYEKVDIRRYILQTICKDGSHIRMGEQELPILCRGAEDTFSDSPKREGRKINIVQYLGIAADETLRIKKHIGKPNIVLPLV